MVARLRTAQTAADEYCDRTRRARGRRAPPGLYFVVNAVFHYLGPSFAVLLPAVATVIGIRQIPAWVEVAGVTSVIAGVAVHRQ